MAELLLDIPVYPIKGQMLSVCVPENCGVMQPLQTVLFGTGIYIVPRQDGRIIIGYSCLSHKRANVVSMRTRKLWSYAAAANSFIRDWHLYCAASRWQNYYRRY